MNPKIEKLLEKRAAIEADYQNRLNAAKEKMDVAKTALDELTSSKNQIDFEEYRAAKNLYTDAKDFYELVSKESTNPSEKEMAEYRAAKAELTAGRTAVFAETIRKLEKPVAEIEKILNAAITDQQTLSAAIDNLSWTYEQRAEGGFLDPSASVVLNIRTGSLNDAVRRFKNSGVIIG